MRSADPQIYALFSALVEELIGMRYDGSGREILLDKLEAAAADAGFDSLLDYYYFLRYDPARDQAIESMIEHLVVAETYFFRELPALEFLVDEVIKPKVQAGLRPRIWSAACATGEEPLTLAMLLDHSGALGSTEILATDISRRGLERAKAGRFRPRSLRQPAPDALVSRYLRREADEVVVDRALIEQITFERLNLFDAGAVAKLGVFDAIICRNVLIYFSEDGIKRVTHLLRERLHEDGVLLVGVSESLFRIDTGLRCEERRGVFFYVKGDA